MANINSYLRFSGNCREAMNHYKNILGGDLVLMPIGESPMAKQMPASSADKILHSTLTNGSLVIMASDIMKGEDRIPGNAVSMMLNCTSENEIRETFDKLAEGGSKDHGLENTFWGAIFGDLTDKYGINWLLNFEKTQPK